MSVDLGEFQMCLLIIIRYGKHDLIEGIKAAWIFHGIGLSWVLAIVISREHYYWINIYKQPIII